MTSAKPLDAIMNWEIVYDNDRHCWLLYNKSKDEYYEQYFERKSHAIDALENLTLFGVPYAP